MVDPEVFGRRLSKLEDLLSDLRSLAAVSRRESQRFAESVARAAE